MSYTLAQAVNLITKYCAEHKIILSRDHKSCIVSMLEEVTTIDRAACIDILETLF